MSSENFSAESASNSEGDSAETSEDSYSRALAIALRRLNAQQRTRSELERTLKEKGIPQSISHSVLDRITDMGYVNDIEYAQLWVKSRFRSRGLAPSVLRRELIAKGVDREVIEAALAEIDPAESLGRAHELALKKLRGVSALTPAIAVRRISAQLMRKGYSSSDSVAIAREVVAGQWEDTEQLPI